MSAKRVEFMSPSLRKAIGAISPPTFQHLISVQTQWFSWRYAYSTSSNGHSFTVSYLIDNCGFSPKQAASASKRVSFETRDKPDSVIKFLKTLGFSQPQIIRFITVVPEFLRSNPEKTFLPKIEFFKSRGVSSSNIPRLICSYPGIMRRSLSKQLIPSFGFLRDIVQSDEKLIKALQYCSGILLDANTFAVPNMELLREAGVPESNVIQLLHLYPRTLTKSPNRFKDIVKEVKEIGINPLKVQFIMAVHVCSTLKKSTRALKADLYKKWGWPDDDILAAFRKYPSFFTVSEDKIDAVMGILVNKLGCDSSTLSKYPTVITLSLKKRIVPRGAVIQVLLSKGLAKKKTLLGIFKLSEKDFLRRHIFRHEQEASELLKLYQSKLDLAR